MILKTLAEVDPSLIKRHQQRALERMNSSEPLSAGLKALPGKTVSFASMQAGWRLYANGSVSLPILQKPLTAAAHESIVRHCSQ